MPLQDESADKMIVGRGSGQAGFTARSGLALFSEQPTLCPQDVAGVESGLRAVAQRAADQQLHHHMFLAEETTDRLVMDIRKRLEGAGDRRADRRRSFKQRAARLRASRYLPDASVGHQRQGAVDLVA